MAHSFFYPFCKRFALVGGYSRPGGPTLFYVKDSEQRCFIHVRVPDEDILQKQENEVAVDIVARHIEELDPEVTLINVSPDGTILSASTDPKHEASGTRALLGWPLDMMPVEWTAHAIPRAKLIEVQRICDSCDLVSYNDPSSGSPMTAVFKYQWDGECAGILWDELNCWIRVSGHPYIVPIDRIITDHSHLPGLGLRDVVVGLTSRFISGGTLRDNRNRFFKLKHLKQLLRVIDDLNLKYGIAHQDIAAYNMIIDPSSDRLQVFDFNCAARIGKERLDPGRPDHYHGTVYIPEQNDVKGATCALYEIITGDEPYPWLEYDSKISDVLDKEWVQNSEFTLDCDPLEYRKTLCEWIRWREQPENTINHYTEAPGHIDWPAPYIPMLPMEGSYQNDPEMKPYRYLSRAHCRSRGVDFIEWKRPAGNKIPDGFCVLGNGELVLKSELDLDDESDSSNWTSDSEATDVVGGS
jgi:hypothetical protein